MQKFFSLLLIILPSLMFAQKVAVVDVQKVFDGYQKVKDARERLEKSSKIAMEEIDIFKDELAKIVKELREMEEKLKKMNLCLFPLEELPLKTKSHINMNRLYDCETFAVAVSYCVLRPKKENNT